MLDDLVHLRRIDKRTLHTRDAGVTGIQRVSATDQLLCALGIQHRSRVNHTLRSQRDTCRDISLDHTCDDVHRRTLCSQNHMHTYRTRFLRDTCNRRLHLLTRLHDEIAILIDDDHDIRQVLVMQTVRHQLSRIQTTSHELIVIILQVTYTGVHEQFIAVLHLDHQRVQSVNHLVAIGDDDLLGIGIRHRRQVMFQQRFVWRKLDHLRIHHHEFQLRRVFLVQQRSDDGIDCHRLTRTGSTGYQQVRRLREIEHKHLVRDRSAVRDRQLHLLLLLETLGCDHRVHAHYLRFLVWHLNTDRSLTRHRRDDTNTRRTQTHHNIVLQRLDLRHTDTCLRHDFIERHGRSYRCFDAINFYAIVAQGRHNTCAVRTLLFLVNDRRILIVIHLQQVQTRELEELQIFPRIVRA